MAADETKWVPNLEGSIVEITFFDVSRIEQCEVISARRRAGTLWVSIGGIDAFIPRTAIRDVLVAEREVEHHPATGRGGAEPSWS